MAATCNNVTVLPPELIRKGRFDELFFVDLPTAAERQRIFAIQLKRRKQDAAGFDLAQLAAASEGYSGAEIDAAVQTAMYDAYASKAAMSTALLIAAIAHTVPLSTTRAEEIGELRHRCPRLPPRRPSVKLFACRKTGRHASFTPMRTLPKVSARW